MNDKVVPLPLNMHKALRRKFKDRYVPCEVTQRYLVFPESSSRINDSNDFMIIDVMTVNEDNQPRKLCQLVLNRHALESALKSCVTRD